MNGVGAHEVIIETPDHEQTLADLPTAAVADVFEAFRSRLVDLKGDGRLEYVLIFKNQGPGAGATLEHSHSQLIALPVVPIYVQEELQGSLSHFRATGRCVYCDIIAGELAAGERIIEESDSFIAFAPFASPSSFETWIVPREHTDRFESSRDHYGELAGLLHSILGRMGRVLGDPDYNFVLHTAPLKQDGTPHYHWHIEIRPQLNRIAGFEWGSGFFINPTPPEQAAAFLREG
jgi:UDPglucose--hexose-1-phosphate uridylyltransferase